ncbi:uncharacterized protein KIAA2013 homolog [Myzus persicae]|uniref:uncharacterized protein KIAA2013 homolog n=1 Tax=Myzus persicae TaxID=13164 RepID=UPI000B933F9B|nr:uncharacterized protein KIAA2013 homolog [Myzus persicae]
MSPRDFLYRLRRSLEKIKISKKIAIVITFIVTLIFYLSPYWRSSNNRSLEYDELFMKNGLFEKLSFHKQAYDMFDANIKHEPLDVDEKPYKEFIGNGYFGITLDYDSPIYVKGNRALSIPIYWHPVIKIDIEAPSQVATVVNYKNGIAYRYECFSNRLQSSIKYFAFRGLPKILVQDIELTNPTDFVLYAKLKQHSLKSHGWSMYSTRPIKLADPAESYIVESGISTSTSDNPIYGVSITYSQFPINVKVAPHSIYKLRIIISIEYLALKNSLEFSGVRSTLEKKSIESILKISHYENIEKTHIDIWEKLWSTGFSISKSKASGVLNGDLINATVYNVLSSVRAPSYEITSSPVVLAKVASSLSYVEGCYGANHDTLQAVGLWSNLSSIEKIYNAVSLWIITLEKQGCHNLVNAGASGVAQAMVLSFGNFRFSNQHLEFNMHPKFLHRDFHFRRLNYGNMTHINVTVSVQENNKAIISVAIDRSDKNYYACDGGCLDEPVLLGPEYKTFPVKLTDPVTGILYLTYDKKHMEDLKHAIHVKEVSEAPAHEHHVLALHKHGHRLGGLPTFFWVAIGCLIVIFHLFLFKLIYNEYFNWQDKSRIKYGKLAYK